MVKRQKKKLFLTAMFFLIFGVILINIKMYENAKEERKKEYLEKYEENKKTDVTTTVDYENELYVSTNGYELRYNPNNFSINYEGGFEEFTHKTEDLYMRMYIVPASDAEVTKETIKEGLGMQGECSFSNGTLNGFYTEELLKEENDQNKVKRNFVFDLDNKDVLIIETKMYASTEKNKTANEQINLMMDTIKFE